MAVPRYFSNENVATGPTGSTIDINSAGASSGGRAIANSLDNLGNTAVDIAAKRQKQDEMLWVANTMSDAQNHWMQEMDNRQKNAGAGAPGFTPQVTEDFQKFASEQLKGAKTGTAQAMLQEQLNSLGTNVEREAMHFESAQRIANIIQTNSQRIDTDAMIAYRNPDQALGIVDKNTAIINNLDGRMDPSHRAGLLQKTNQEVVAAALRGYGDTDPNKGIALIDSGKLDGKMDSQQLINLREHLSTLAKTKNSQNAWDTKDAIEGALAQVEAGKGMPLGPDGLPLTPERLAAQLGGRPDEIAARTSELQKQFEKANTVGVGVSSLQFADPVKMAQTLDMYKPHALPTEAGTNPDGTPIVPTKALLRDQNGNLVESKLNYKDQEEVYNKLTIFAKHAREQFTKDPNGYTQQEPTVRASYQQAEDAFNNKDPNAPALMQAAIRKSIVLQQQMGLASYEVQPIGKDQQVAIAENMMKQKPEDLRNFLFSLESKYKGYSSDILNSVTQLPKGQAPDFKYVFAAMNARNPQAFNTIVGAIRELKKDPSILEDSIKNSGEKTASFDEKVYGPDSAASKLSNAMTLSTGGIEWGNQFKKTVSDVAKYLYVSGDSKTPDEAVKNANAMMVDSQYSDTPNVHGRSYVIPMRPDGKPYGAEDASELQRIKANAEILPKIMGDMLSRHVEQLPAGTESRLKNLSDNGIWVTKKDHIELWGDLGPLIGRTPIRVKDGRFSTAPDAKPLSFSFQDLSNRIYQEHNPQQESQLVPN